MITWWVTLARAAPLPDADATGVFLDWHCSPDNVWRYGGPLELAQAPPGLRALADAGITWPLEIGPDGTLPTPNEGFDALVIAEDTPVDVAARSLHLIERSIDSDALQAVALAVPDTFAPRPAPPLEDEVLELVRTTLDDFRRLPSSIEQVSMRWAEASGKCPEALDLLVQRRECSEVAAQLASDLRRRRCRMDAATALAMFAVTWHRGEGQPVLLAPIAVRGADVLKGEGTWGTAGPAFLSGPDPAMTRDPSLPPEVPAEVSREVPRDGVHVFHHSELEVKKRVQPEYPGEARPLALGDQRCLVKVWIDPTGTPIEAVVESCPTVFHESTRQALLGWRWYPPKVSGTPVTAQTTISVIYRLVKDPPAPAPSARQEAVDPSP